MLICARRIKNYGSIEKTQIENPSMMCNCRLIVNVGVTANNRKKSASNYRSRCQSSAPRANYELPFFFLFVPPSFAILSINSQSASLLLIYSIHQSSQTISDVQLLKSFQENTKSFTKFEQMFAFPMMRNWEILCFKIKRNKKYWQFIGWKMKKYDVNAHIPFKTAVTKNEIIFPRLFKHSYTHTHFFFHFSHSSAGFVFCFCFWK